MNIKQAKEQIKNAMTAYFSKDDMGEYMMPAHKQRPVFLMGPPGIGKTAIMEQVAAEMGVGLLSYSMTHHTRQSALGLPFIVHKEYEGMEYDISEYTMSEIIASVYDLMEKTGLKEGILFLDEINCVSETLAPVMLQFLQYKVFGRHRVPDGWIIVTAGNPPEYNDSVREFDIVTWDRLKRIDIEPDFDAWKEYALKVNVHPAVVSFLECKKQYFYRIQASADGKRFVTARGWEDLSQMIRLYEKNEIMADNLLIGQYLQDPEIAREFAQYYDLFNKYRSNYQFAEILEGKEEKKIRDRAKKAKFDERLSLIALLLDRVTFETGEAMERTNALAALMDALKTYRSMLIKPGVQPRQAMEQLIAEKIKEHDAKKAAGFASTRETRVLKRLIRSMECELALIKDTPNAKSAFMAVKQNFDAMVQEEKKNSDTVAGHLQNLYAFAENVWGDSQEMLIITTELTLRGDCAAFIMKYGCDAYYRYNRDLILNERHTEIIEEIEALDLDALDSE